MTRRRIQTAQYLLVFILIALMIATRFLNPALTETELFLKYGWLYVAGGAIVLMVIARMGKAGEG